MDGKKVTESINELAREEHELFDRESHGTATDADREGLQRLQITLDQCWVCPASGKLGQRALTPMQRGFETRK